MNKFSGEKSRQGIAILTSILFMGFILAIAFGLSAIFIPKIRLSVDVKSSPTALYAADSGLEWCLYINFKNPSPLPTPIVFGNSEISAVASPSNCAGSRIQSTGAFRGVNRSLQVDF